MLEAAVELISERGFARTTLAEIGVKAGYSRGLVTHRFGSKMGLVPVLIDHLHRVAIDEVVPRAVAGKVGIEALLAAGDSMLAALESETRSVRAFYMLMAESVGLVPELRPVFALANQRFRREAAAWLEQGKQRGEIRPNLDPEAEALLLVAAIRGIVSQWLVEAEGFDVAGARAALRESLRRSIAPAPPESQP